MTQIKHVIIVEALITWFMYLLWKRTKLIIWLGFQKEQPLTTKDLKRYGYQKPHLDFVCRNQGNIESGFKIMLAQDTWSEMVHCS
jgi:hypothetical protein